MDTLQVTVVDSVVISAKGWKKYGFCLKLLCRYLIVIYFESFRINEVREARSAICKVHVDAARPMLFSAIHVTIISPETFLT